MNLSSEVAEGTWKLRVQDLYEGHSGTIDSWALNVSGGTPDCTGTNNADVPISDVSTVNSSVAVSGGCAGYASETSQVKVDIVHTYSGDLVVTLVAPDGSTYLLRDKTGGAMDDIHETYTLDLSAETRTGIWKLRVEDVGFGFTGYIDTWKLNLGNGHGTGDGTGGGQDNISKAYPVNLSSEARDGTWKLQGQDTQASDMGRVDYWTLTL